MSAPDLETLAVNVAIKVEDILKSCKIERRSASALSRRAKDLPSLVQQAGLFQATVFYLSKVENEDLYSGIYKALVDSQQQSSYSNKIDCAKVAEEVSGEGKGYTLLLAVLTRAISEYSKQQLNIRECNEIDTIINIAKCIQILREKGLLLMIERALNPYLITVKRLFEALYQG